MKSIADVVGASGLAGYAEVALLIFFVVFVAVGLRTLMTNQAALDHAAHLPLDDDIAPRTIDSQSANGRKS